jgi:hypothetical protein
VEKATLVHRVVSKGVRIAERALAIARKGAVNYHIFEKNDYLWGDFSNEGSLH